MSTHQNEQFKSMKTSAFRLKIKTKAKPISKARSESEAQIKHKSNKIISELLKLGYEKKYCQRAINVYKVCQ